MAEYAAFISYSHAADGKLAPILQRALQAFSKPWYRLRAIRVFRDEANLSATPALWPSVESALKESRFFVLLASPEAAASSWVNREVKFWLKNKSIATILIALTGGELAFDSATLELDWSRTTALPGAFKGAFKSQPRYVDLRWTKTTGDLSARHPRFREAVADLASAIRGVPKDQLVGDDLRLHRRALRTAWSGVIALLIATGVAAWQAVVANQQRKVAEARARTATSRLLASEALTTFERDPTVSFRLAEVALQVEPTLEAQRALFRVFDSRRCFSTAILRHTTAVADAAFSPDGRLIVTTNDGYRSLHLWDGATYEEIRRVGATLFGERVAFSQDGTQLLTVFSPRYSGTRELVAWDVRTGFARQAWLGIDVHQPSVQSEYVRLTGERFVDRRGLTQRSPKSTFVAKATGRIATVLDPRSGAEVCQLVGHQDDVVVVRFSLDGTRIMTASLDGTVRIRFTPTELHRREVPALTSRFQVEADSANERIVSITDTMQRIRAQLDGRTIRILDVASGKELRRLIGHTGTIVSAAFSPDGRQLLSLCQTSVSLGEFDRTARLWDVETGQELRQFDRDALEREALSPAYTYDNAVAFSADGTSAFIEGAEVPTSWIEMLRLINEDHVRGIPARLTDDEIQRFGVPSTLNRPPGGPDRPVVPPSPPRRQSTDASVAPINGACVRPECFVNSFAACEPVSMSVEIDPLTDEAARYQVVGPRTEGCAVSVQDTRLQRATCVLDPNGDFVAEFQREFDAAVAGEKSSCTGSLVDTWRNIMR